MKRVLVTGATGFTGSTVVPLLMAHGYSVRCFVRPSSNRSSLPSTEIDWVVGDLSDYSALASAMKGADVLINVASLGFGHAPTIVNAARTSEVRRAVFVSTTAVSTTLDVRSKAVRLAAERTIADSGVVSTILRPTMIYGGPRDRNIYRLIRFLKISPLIPIFGSGGHLQQPVHVSDVAQALVACATAPQAEGRTYNVAGPQPLTYGEIIDTVALVLKRRLLKVHVPVGPVMAGTSLIESIGLRLPIRSEQVRRLEEDKVFDNLPAAQDFGYAPKSFVDGVRLEVEDMARHD